MHIFAIIGTTAVLALIALSAVPCAEKACGQAADNKIRDISTLNSELAPAWDRTVSLTNDAQWTLTGLQGFQGAKMSGRPLTDRDRQSINSLMNNANTDISQWSSGMQDMKNELAVIESRTDYPAMSPADAAKARAKITELHARLNQLDIVMSQLKNTPDMINKNM